MRLCATLPTAIVGSTTLTLATTPTRVGRWQWDVQTEAVGTTRVEAEVGWLRETRRQGR